MNIPHDDGMFARSFRCASEKASSLQNGRACYGLEQDESDYAIAESDSRDLSGKTESEISDMRVETAQKSERAHNNDEEMLEVANKAEKNFEAGMAEEHSESLNDAGKDQIPSPLQQLVRAEIMSVLQPILQAVQVERHFAALAAAHPDYERIAADPDLTAWIDEQPAVMNASLKKIVEHGSAPEVIELLSRYKQDRTSRQAEMPPHARNLEAVRSRGGGPPKTQSRMLDFRGAWDEAAAFNE
jgi:hypothetical protein